MPVQAISTFVACERVVEGYIIMGDTSRKNLQEILLSCKYVNIKEMLTCLIYKDWHCNFHVKGHGVSV